MSEDIAAEYESLLQFLYLAPVGLVQCTASGDIVMINPLSAQLLMPLSRDGMLDNFFNAMESVAPELRNISSSFSAPSGTICDGIRVQVSAGIYGKEDPKVLAVSLIKLDADRLMAVLTDVTIVVKRERQLKQTEAWFNAIMVGVTDYALMSLDANGNIEQWNASIGRMTGLDADAVTNKPYSTLYPSGSYSQERIADYLHEATESGWALSEGWCLRAPAERFWGSTLIVPLERSESTVFGASSEMKETAGFALIIRDITNQRESRDAVLKASLSDHLTGVANRRAFFEAADIELKRWRRAPRPLSLLTLDADHFKRINDTYGHPAGDAVLKNLGATLLQTVRDMDIVARIGGEEFAILLPSTGLEEAQVLAERIREKLSAQEVEVDNAIIRYTVSIGISTMQHDLTGMDKLLKLADNALYNAKRNGRNRIETALQTGTATV